MKGWSLERILFLFIGVLVLTGVFLGWSVSRYWLILAILPGLGSVMYSFTGFCPSAYLLKKLGLKSAFEKG
jgi:hypothetical protein